jgi:hypothetical protein
VVVVVVSSAASEPPVVFAGLGLLLEHATATAPAPTSEAPKKIRNIRMMKALQI